LIVILLFYWVICFVGCGEFMSKSKGILEALSLLNPKSSSDFVRVSGGGGEVLVTREVVLSALHNLSVFESMFAFALVDYANARPVLGKFSDVAYRSGFECGNAFRLMAFESMSGKRDLFPPLWLAAWRSYCSSRGKISDRCLAGLLCVGRSKVVVIRPVFDDAVSLLHDTELRVSTHLFRNLK